MSHYYGTVTGQAKTTATRRGSKNSEISATVASWAGACKISLAWSETHQADRLLVELVPWHSVGIRAVLYDGMVDQAQPWPGSHQEQLAAAADFQADFTADQLAATEARIKAALDEKDPALAALAAQAVEQLIQEPDLLAALAAVDPNLPAWLADLVDGWSTDGWLMAPGWLAQPAPKHIGTRQPAPGTTAQEPDLLAALAAVDLSLPAWLAALASAQDRQMVDGWLMAPGWAAQPAPARDQPVDVEAERIHQARLAALAATDPGSLADPDVDQEPGSTARIIVDTSQPADPNLPGWLADLVDQQPGAQEPDQAADLLADWPDFPDLSEIGRAHV